MEVSKRWYIISSLIMFAILSLPYLFGWSRTPEGYIFTGFLLDQMDNATYIAKMRGAIEGWSFINYYNPVVQDGGYHFLLYILLGKISLLFNIPFIVGFHIGRLLLIVFFLWSLYLFIESFKFKANHKKLMFILITVGGTNEYITALGNILVYGDTIKRVFDPAILPSTALLYSPHIILVLALQLHIWRIAKDYLNNPVFNSIKIGLLLTIIYFVHPYTTVIMGTIVGLYIVYKLYKYKNLHIKKVSPLLLFGIIPFPFLLYSLLSFQQLPTLVQWQNEAYYGEFNILNLFQQIGLPFLLILIVLLNKKFWEGDKSLFSWWFLSTLIITISPLYMGIRLGDGILIPVFALITFYILQFDKKLFQGTLIVLLMLNTLWLVLEPLHQSKINPHRYITKEQQQAYDWLEEHTGKQTIVFSDMINSNYVPAMSSRTVVYGHDHESPNYFKKRDMWESYCQTGKLPDSIEFDFILLDDKMNCIVEIENTPVYSNGQIKIYKKENL